MLNKSHTALCYLMELLHLHVLSDLLTNALAPRMGPSNLLPAKMIFLKQEPARPSRGKGAVNGSLWQKHRGLHKPAWPSFTPFQEGPLQTDLWVPKRKTLTCCPPQRGKFPHITAPQHHTSGGACPPWRPPKV